MNIIAIDPGPEHSGLVCFDGKRILQHAVFPNPDLLESLRAYCAAKIDRFVVVEMVASYGMPAGADLFQTAFFAGRCAQVAAAAGVPWRQLYRIDVKRAICRDTRAKDGNIRQALIDRFGKPGTKKGPGATYGLAGDEWQAFGLAVTAFDLMNKELPFDRPPLAAVPRRDPAPDRLMAPGLTPGPQISTP
jgi:hypothetical protein